MWICESILIVVISGHSIKSVGSRSDNDGDGRAGGVFEEEKVIG